MLSKKWIRLLLGGSYLKYVIYFCALFFYGCGDSGEVTNLKEAEKQLRVKTKICETKNNKLTQQVHDLHGASESCKTEFGETKIVLAQLKTQLNQAETTIKTDKENLRLKYEAEFSGDLRNKFIQEKKDLMTELEKEKNEFEWSLIKVFIMILVFILTLCFIFYMLVKSHYIRKEDNLKAKIERKEDELNAKLAVIEDEKTAMLNKIYTRDIYGQKLNETINILKSELNKPKDSSSGEPK